jgi:ferredoxin
VTLRLAIALDTTRCKSYGICVSVLPEVFDTPASSPAAVLLVDTVGEEDRDDLEEAVRNCPAQAISFTSVA